MTIAFRPSGIDLRRDEALRGPRPVGGDGPHLKRHLLDGISLADCQMEPRRREGIWSRIDVIILCYNHDRFLSQCVNSALGQSGGRTVRIGPVTKPQDMPDLVEGAPRPKQPSYGEILKSSALIGFSTLINLAIGNIRTKAMAVWLGPAGFRLMGLYSSIADPAQSIASGMGSNASGVRRSSPPPTSSKIAATLMALATFTATQVIKWGEDLRVRLREICERRLKNRRTVP